jgi:DnaJ-class molecular chaperone
MGYLKNEDISRQEQVSRAQCYVCEGRGWLGGRDGEKCLACGGTGFPRAHRIPISKIRPSN